MSRFRTISFLTRILHGFPPAKAYLQGQKDGYQSFQQFCVKETMVVAKSGGRKV